MFEETRSAWARLKRAREELRRVQRLQCITRLLSEASREAVLARAPSTLLALSEAHRIAADEMQNPTPVKPATTENLAAEKVFADVFGHLAKAR